MSNKVIVDEVTIRKKMLDYDIKTIDSLSKQSGVSKPTIYEYFNGKSPISSSFEKLCRAIDLDPLSAIIGITDSEEE